MGSKGVKKAKNKGIWTGLGIAVVVAIIAIAVFGMPFSTTPTGEVTGEVQQTCNADFSKTFTLNSKNFYEPTEEVDTAETVIYKLWLVEGEEKIPQTDLEEGDTFTLLRGQEMEVVATVNGTVDVINVRKVFSIDNACVASPATSFEVKAVPASLTVRVDNIDIDGAMTSSNTIPITQGSEAVASAIFTGESDTMTNAVIVLDADQDELDDIEADIAEVDVPAGHTVSAVGEKAYAFALGDIEEVAKVYADFIFTADEEATVGDYNVSYTVYSIQNGYVNSDTGNWDDVESVTDNDDETLLPTYTGTMYLTVSS